MRLTHMSYRRISCSTEGEPLPAMKSQGLAEANVGRGLDLAVGLDCCQST